MSDPKTPNVVSLHQERAVADSPSAPKAQVLQASVAQEARDQPYLPPQLAKHLTGLALTGFPAEAPWNEPRPSWAIDATPEEVRQLVYFLAWFYGLGDPFDPLSAPLSPTRCFFAVGQTIHIRAGSSTAQFDFYPSSQAKYSDLLSLAKALCTWRRQPTRIRVQSATGKSVYVEIHIWTRPEYITQAIMQVPARTHRGGDLKPGRRGRDEQGGQFGVIPIDLDYSEGDHAPSANGLRRPTKEEAQSVLALSRLPWSYKIVGGGGEYNYLKLAEPMSFEDDPIAAKEIIQGAQRELCDAAKLKGYDVDLAFKGATSLCRVPFSTPLKYLWGHGKRVVLKCPDLDTKVVVSAEDLEQYRSRSRTARTRRKITAHGARLKRDGDSPPRPLSSCFEVRVKDLKYGRIYILRRCPLCGDDGHKAHIGEIDWKLRCKRASCKAAGGIGYETWLKEAPPDTRSELRKHIIKDIALSRLVEHPPLKFESDPTHTVRDFLEGKNVVQKELERMHNLGISAQRNGRQPRRIAFIQADCGAGKSYGASEASKAIPMAYSAPQYSLLDEFRGHAPYQIQGLSKGCRIDGVGELASDRGVGRSYLCR